MGLGLRTRTQTQYSRKGGHTVDTSLLKYIAKRLALTVPVLIGITILTFLLVNVAPGDVVDVLLGDKGTEEGRALIERQLNLDKPLATRYLLWMGRVVRGDLGTSYITHKEVLPTILRRAVITGEIGLLAFIFALLGALPLGVLSATNRNGWIDHLARVVALTGISIPSFWLAIIFLLVFCVILGWFPTGGFVPLSKGLWANLRSVFLPAAILGFVNMGSVTRMLRAGMIESLSANYVDTARAMGIREKIIVWNDALKNAFIPTLTVIGIAFALVLSGSILVETVFSIPGLGRLVAESVFNRDLPLIQGVLLTVGTIYVFVNLLVDVLYTFLDPRIKY